MEIVVALGGGGVKGAAHLGVMRALQRAGFEIKGIAGSSAGAMIGSFIAAGFSMDEIQGRLNELDQNHLFQRKQGEGPGFLGLAPTAALIAGFVGKLQFDELKLPFAVTATNMDTGQPEIISEGPVLEAVLASIAVPGVFPPQKYETKVMIDGAVLDPVPVKLARSLRPDLPVVAVVLSPTLEEWPTIPVKRGLFTSIPFVGNLADRLIWAQAIEIFTRAVDIGGLLVTDLRLEIEKPEIIIRPDVHDVGLVDKIDVDKLVMAGELAVLKQIPYLRAALAKPTWSRRLTKALAHWLIHNYPALGDEMVRQKYGS